MDTYGGCDGIQTNQEKDARALAQFLYSSWIGPYRTADKDIRASPSHNRGKLVGNQNAQCAQEQRKRHCTTKSVSLELTQIVSLKPEWWLRPPETSVSHKQEPRLFQRIVKRVLKEGFEYKDKGRLLLGILIVECSFSQIQTRAPSFQFLASFAYACSAPTPSYSLCLSASLLPANKDTILTDLLYLKFGTGACGEGH